MYSIDGLDINKSISQDLGTPYYYMGNIEHIHSIFKSDKQALVSFYWSNDSINLDYVESYKLLANIGDSKIISVKAKYLSITYSSTNIFYPVYFRCSHLFI